MKRIPARIRNLAIITIAAIFSAAGEAPEAFCCPYSRLQVLLPGESAAPGTESGIAGYPLAQVAGVPFQVVVRACDPAWQTVTSVRHVIRLTSTDGAAVLPGAQTTIGGVVTMTVILNSTGSFTVTATDLTDGEHYTATSSAVEVTGGAGSAERLEFSHIDAGQKAGVPFYLEVMAVDHNGNTDTGFSGPVELRQITSLGEGRIQPASISLSGGEWSGPVAVYLADESRTECTGGSVKISGVCGADRAVAGMSGCFTVLPGDFARLQIVVPGQTRAPSTLGGLNGSPATQLAGRGFQADIYATDEYWNMVQASDAVRVVSNDLDFPVPFTGILAGGHVRFPVIFAAAGTRTLTVTDDSNCDILGMTSDGIPVISDDPTFVIEPVTGPVTAGEPAPVSIKVVDNNGEIIAGYNGHAMLAAVTGPGTITPESIRFAGGSWSGEMTFFCAGEEVSFSCIDYAMPPNIGTSNAVKVLPGAFAGLQVILPGQSPTGGVAPGIEGTPRFQTAGAMFETLVRAVDSWWNVVPEINDGVELLSTDAYAEVPSGIILSGGVAVVPMTFFRAGTHFLSLADPGSDEIPGCTSSEFDVLPGPYARIIMLAPGEEPVPGSETGKAGEPTDQSIRYSFTLGVVATDEWWNHVGGVYDLIEISTTDPLAELPPGMAMDDGLAEPVLRLCTGGYQLITAENNSNPLMAPATSQVRAINSGFHFEAEVTPERVQAGEPFTLTVRVTNDAGAIMQEVNSFAIVEAVNADNGEPGDGELLAPQFQLLQGKRTIRQTYTKSQSVLFVIRDQEGNEPGMTNIIVVEPAAPSQLVMESELPWIGGNRSMTVSAGVFDEFGNGVPGQPVTFELTDGTGTIAPLDEFTGENGIARARFTSPYEPEIGIIRAVSNGLDADLTVQTAHVDPNSAGGSVTNYPNPFHPGESSTTIAYVLSDDASVTMKLYTLSGGLVFSRRYAAGEPGGASGLNEVLWDGRNGNGDHVSSGGYVLFVEAVRSGETIHTMRRRIGVVR